MTERLPPLQTQTSTPSQTVVPSPRSAPTFPNHVPSKTLALPEEEPYTIKCICDFIEDDGNTIYCENCDTWQHIECYYPHQLDLVTQDDFNHACVECVPRGLDRKRAREHQISRQSNIQHSEASERKATKRPIPKGQKKKAKPMELAVQVVKDLENSTKHVEDSVHQHQHRKSKSVHRPSQSVGSQPVKRSPPYVQKSANPHGHPPSPATTPQDLPHELDIHNYSSRFIDSYKEDQDVAIVETNSFASLTISNALSAWLRDDDAFRKDVGVEFREVFRDLPPNIDSVKASPVVRSKKLALNSDTIVHWQYLATRGAVDKDTPLIELNGLIGIQKDYCHIPSNRWQDLSCPLPFVFFHPMLPLYIDTRTEGSLARYVRRSCTPNTTLETFLSGGTECHFWLVSERPIRANEQITIQWPFKLPKAIKARWLQLLGLFDEEQPEYDENETATYHAIAAWVHVVLSEYGGCACDLGAECAFTRFHRKYITRTQGKDKASKLKRSRKSKPNNVSPTSTGQATNSRAGSENCVEDGVDHEAGSARSKPLSRDLTPAPRQGSFDTLGILTEPTDRDKRKVQMVEDSFRRMEQQQPPRKKKRISDGTSSSATHTTKPKTKSVSTHATVVNSTSDRQYIDAGTSGSNAGSPISAVSPTTDTPLKPNGQRSSVSISPRNAFHAPRPEYRDVAVQTDPVEGAWFSHEQLTPRPRKRIVSLSKRLLESRHRLRTDDESRRRSAAASPVSVASAAMVNMDLESPKAEQSATATSPPKSPNPAAAVANAPIATAASDDTVMTDAPVALPVESRALSVSSSTALNAVKVKTPELRVQLPPVPTFSSSSAANAATTPASANSSMVQSPFSASNLHGSLVPPLATVAPVQPSPVKKKLSLSDYTKSRMNKVAAAKSSASSKPRIAVIEEAKPPVSTDAIMTESPVHDKKGEA